MPEELPPPEGRMLPRVGAMIALVLAVSLLGYPAGLTPQQVLSLGIFFATVFGTLFFWGFRLAIAFMGIAALLVTRTIDVENVIRFSSLDVILFLIGMMVLVGALNDLGFFYWIIWIAIHQRHVSWVRLVISICVLSALLACAVDEVSSIIFMVTIIFQICMRLKVKPIPFIVISILSTNIGSAGTMLGNPIGVLIGTKAGLTFEDFLVWAFPLMLGVLGVTIGVISLLYRRELKELDLRIEEFMAEQAQRKGPPSLMPPIPYIGIIVFVVTLVFIALHYRLELLFHLPKNTVLLIAPLISAGVIMSWRREQAKKYIEQDVDWWTLIFFLLLFAKAGTLKYTGVTEVLAGYLMGLAQQSLHLLTSLVLWLTFLFSGVLDNIVFVAAFIPVIKSFKAAGVNVFPLWWALLFGGCLGGNITMVGSTANIVALGILEKNYKYTMGFREWLRVGFIVGLISTGVAWAGILLLSRWMPV